MPEDDGSLGSGSAASRGQTGWSGDRGAKRRSSKVYEPDLSNVDESLLAELSQTPQVRRVECTREGAPSPLSFHRYPIERYVAVSSPLI